MRAIAALCIVASLGVAGLWVAHGTHMGTRTEIPHEEKVIDDFGDEEIKIVWKDGFELGLDFAGPGAGGLLVAGFGLLFWARRRS